MFSRHLLPSWTIVLLTAVFTPAAQGAKAEIILAELSSGSVGSGAPVARRNPNTLSIPSRFADALRAVDFANGLTQNISNFGATTATLQSLTPEVCSIVGMQITVFKAGSCQLSGSYTAPGGGGNLAGGVVVGKIVVASAVPSAPPPPTASCQVPNQCVITGAIPVGATGVRVTGNGPNGASASAAATLNQNGTYSATINTTPGEWRFSAVATSAAGDSAPSQLSGSAVSVVQPVIPQRPTEPSISCSGSSCTATGIAPEGTTSVEVIGTQSGSNRTLSSSNGTFDAATRAYSAVFQMPSKESWTFTAVASSSLGSSPPSAASSPQIPSAVVNPCGGTTRICNQQANGASFSQGQPLTVTFRADPNQVTKACLSVTQTRAFGGVVTISDDRVYSISHNVTNTFAAGIVLILTNSDCDNWPSHWTDHGLDRNPGTRTSQRPGVTYVSDVAGNSTLQADLVFDISGLSFSVVGEHLEANLPGATGGTGTGALSYSASGQCSLADVVGVKKIRALGTGACTVTALKAGSTVGGVTYGGRTSVSTVNISAPASKYSQSALAVTPPAALSPSASVTLQTSGGSGTGAVSYSVVSGNCSIAGSTLTAPSSLGTCTVRATKADSALFASATSADLPVTIACGAGSRVIEYRSDASCNLASTSDLGNACVTEQNSDMRVARPTLYGYQSYAMLCYADKQCLYVSEQSCPGGNGCQPWQLRAWNMIYPSANGTEVRQGGGTSACKVGNW